MGIKLRNQSISDIFLMAQIIKKYCADNKKSLFEINKIDEIAIQKSYDRIGDEINKEVNDYFDKSILGECLSDLAVNQK